MIQINFDGACWPNPGGLGTYGFAIYRLEAMTPESGDPFARRKLLRSGSGQVGRGEGITNNVAEYTALIQGVRALFEIDEPGILAEGLKIVGDSQLVINQLNGAWQCNKESLQKLLEEARSLLAAFCVMLEWRRRDQNTEADQLSVKEWERIEGRLFPEMPKRKPA